MVQVPIKVAVVGFDDRSVLKLAQAFEEKAKKACVITPEIDSQVVLLNLDASDFNNLYEDFELRNLSLPVIGIGRTFNEGWETTQITTPFTTVELVTTIRNSVVSKGKTMVNKITDDKVAAALSAINSRNVAKSLDKRLDKGNKSSLADRAIPQKTDEMCFDVERFLLGFVINAKQTAVQSAKNAVIQCWGDKTVVLEPKQGKIYTNMNDNQIRNMAIAPVDDSLACPVTTEYFETESQQYLDIVNRAEMRALSMEVFMWNLGSMTCRGRIPIETSISERQFLIRWPNITRIKLSNNAMRIIAYWVKQPCGLYDLQQALDVSLQDVFTVFTAAYAAGLANNTKRSADNLFELEKVQDNDKRGLFGAIVNRLKKMNREAA